MTENAYVSLGSNLGDRAGHLLFGVRGMMAAGLNVIRLSSIYETEPVDLIAQPPFLNMVAEVRGSTLPTPEQTMARLLRVEYALGRRREIKAGPRTLDLDLLFYKDELSDTEFLRLPHPRLHLRKFILIPLNELAPDLIHPKFKKTVAFLLKNAKDTAEVRRWSPAG